MKKLLAFLCAFAVALVCVLILPVRAEATSTTSSTNAVDSGDIDVPFDQVKKVRKIYITTTPNQLVYQQGESLNTAGMVVKAMYSDGLPAKEISGYTVSGYSADTLGEQTITVSFGGKTTSFKVTVVPLEYTYTTENKTTTITGYVGEGSDVVIPATLGGYPVTTIGNGAFENCISLISLTIPDSVTSIGNSAFNGCTNLSGVIYLGTKCQWKNVAVAENNNNLLEVNLEYSKGEHSFTRYVSDNNATCLGDGTKTAKCDHCERIDIRTDVGSALEHEYKPAVTLPTCLESGYTTNTCSCGDSYVVNEVPKLGHSYANGSCIRCGDTPADVKLMKPLADITVEKGSYAAVSVQATGDELTYSWYHKNATASKFAKAPQTGATYSAYMSDSSNGRYVYCVVADKYGNEVTSNTVRLYMANFAKITTQPTNVAVPSGKYATVTVKATGDGLTYAWYHKNASASKFAKAPQTGADYSAYMSASFNGRYVYCMVTDAYGNSVKTNTVKLTMANTVKITAQPKNTVAPSGKYATVTVKATGDGLTYTWYHRNATASKFAKAPQTGATYSAYMSSSSNGRYVYCIVKDQYGNQIKADTVKLIMGNTVKITTQPKTVAVAKNAKATVSVQATGDGLTYTWYHKNASASAFAKAPQTGSSYSAYVTAASNGRYVYCIVKDKYGNQVKTTSVALRMK